ncbi:MAG: hypothetical protein FJ078_06950 [Cyanobacteria bacterium K_DeepCast_35m_m2_155]|nr:hypothetical protein [Cyanobacteria bacterium K_DeepCast_35m_m2_155]
MPDFEALIRRQQDQRTTADQRLTLVEPTPTSQAIGAPLAVLAFAGALLGSLIGSVGVQWAQAQGWLSF